MCCVCVWLLCVSALCVCVCVPTALPWGPAMPPPSLSSGRPLPGPKGQCTVPSPARLPARGAHRPAHALTWRLVHVQGALLEGISGALGIHCVTDLPLVASVPFPVAALVLGGPPSPQVPPCGGALAGHAPGSRYHRGQQGCGHSPRLMARTPPMPWPPCPWPLPSLDPPPGQPDGGGLSWVL